VHGRPDDIIRAFFRRHAVVAGYSLTAGFPDISYDEVGGFVRSAFAIVGSTQVVHNHAGTLRGYSPGVGATQSVAGAGDNRHPFFKHFSH
jgi:hypothetical protein